MIASKRFLIRSLAIVVAASVLAAAGTIWQTRQTAQAQQLQQLQSATDFASYLQKERFSELQLRAQAMAKDSAFVDYIAHALIPDPALGGAPDRVSIGDLLSQRRQGFAVAMVLDNRGQQAAISGVLLRAADSIAHDPLVTRAIATGKPTHGMWVSQGKLLRVAVNPLLRGGALQGLLLTANRVDDAFANALAELTRADVAVVTNEANASPAAQSGGLDPTTAAQLQQNSREISDVGDNQGSVVTLAGERGDTSAWVTPLPDSEGAAALVVIDDSDVGGSRIDVAAWPLLGGIALLGLLAMMAVVIQWRRTLVPLERIVDVLDRAAAGDVFVSVRVDGSASVHQLRDAANRLLTRYRG